MIKVHSLPYSANTAERIGALIERVEYPILMDSGKPGSNQGRWDLFVANPSTIICQEGTQVTLKFDGTNQISDQDLATTIIRSLQRSGLSSDAVTEGIPFIGGAAGQFDYEWGMMNQLKCFSENSGITAHVGIYHWVFAQDHATERSYLVENLGATQSDIDLLLTVLNAESTPNNAHYRCSEFTPQINFDQYRESIERTHEYILAGDVYQINFTQCFSAEFSGDSFSCYQILKDELKSPFSCYMRTDDKTILSVSPERFISITQSGHVDTRPIKGTAPRGLTSDEDQLIAKGLSKSEKDRAENLMIVDLLRNDIGKHCVAGSIDVPKLFELQSFPNVHHLVSQITGQLLPDISGVDLILDALPGGSITGAPKLRAMEVIDELEHQPRSSYCGTIGYFGINGQCDTNIAIRTVEIKDHKAQVWAGGGIVADSLVDSEYSECSHKIGRLIDTICKHSSN